VSVPTDHPVIRTVHTRSYGDVIRLLKEIGYTRETWRAGVREIPRLRLTRIPERWQDEAPDIPVQDKKNIFFRLTGSGILQANEVIANERQRLLDTLRNDGPHDQEWLLALALKYKVIASESETLDTDKLAQLKRRVDIIPPSLALAQAAEESGWGTSRFAVQGNSLFGQWDFSGGGIRPEQQRSQLGNYSIASFETPQDSVTAYMLNLNTHRAYRKLRGLRAQQRAKNEKPTGWELAKALDKYSERGKAYVDSLHAIMKVNQLSATDNACQWDQGTIVLDPEA